MDSLGNVLLPQYDALKMPAKGLYWVNVAAKQMLRAI
ncbi:MAG: hypothetical protein IPO07_09915 [Haliscomenobacter sp.]|nr:hypothetical protein [Haliscomenobacter sp.]